MERLRFTTIAHRGHRFLSPIADARADALLDRLGVGSGDRVLDVGCGRGEFLVRLAERHRSSGVGIDLNPDFLTEARSRHKARAPGVAIEWLAIDGRSYDAPAVGFDAALCIAATHALGGYDEALRVLRKWVRPGGYVLLGEGYWKQEPDPGYLEFLGAVRQDYRDHAGNLARGVEHGLRALDSMESSLEEWDAYEDLYSDSVERFAAEHPEDPDTPAMLDRIRAWRAAYLRWGRDTLGFGFYLFSRPEA